MTVSNGATGSLAGIGFQDHTKSSEYQIFGPPGTGKTTSLAGLIRRDAGKYGSDALLVTSFSRTAAAELVKCDLPVNPHRVGTLHSHCFAALGSTMIAEAHVRDWNRIHPALALTPVKDKRRLHGETGVGEDDDGAARGGDRLLQELNRCRGLMIPQASWPAAVRAFERKWSRYKHDARLLDFCDLIERCLIDVPTAPGKPSIIFADEAQDLNSMQLKLLRKWGDQADYHVLAFDDDQTIYTFTGASPDAILDPTLPADHKVILGQSYRVPRAVHHFAEKLIGQVRKRQEKVYRARPERGRVVRLGTGGYKSPEYIIVASAMKHLEQGKTVMFLGSCSYMLRPLTALLRRNSVPFHNPYRESNGFWNPLRLSSRGSASRRVLALVAAHPDWAGRESRWDRDELLLWTDWIAPNFLKAGGREILSIHPPATVSLETLAEVLESAVLESLRTAFAAGYQALLRWWCAHLAPEFRRRVAFACNVALRSGAPGLVEEPGAVAGTIHSVKGGQADVVYLFPDLSKAADERYQQHGDPRDSVIRVFYVGATRARETLYICSPESAMSISM